MEKEFIQLIKENERILLKVCNVYCRETEDREDLYQDILIQLWKAFPGFDHRAKVSTWMYRIAFNTAVSRYRKIKKGPIREPLDNQLSVEMNAREKEGENLLYSAIESLDKIEKAIVTLYLNGARYKEIGEVLGISDSNVGFKLNGIKKKLKKRLKKDE